MPRTILSAAVILGLRYHSIIDAGRATGPRAMRMALLLVVCGLICWPTPSLAQNVKHTQNNLDQALRSDFRVDPTTLGLGFQLTLSGYPGRGGTSMPVTLSYSSKLWRMNVKDTFGAPYSTFPRTRVEAKYAEFSVAGWTTSLAPPRLEGLEWMPYDYTGAGVCTLTNCLQAHPESAIYYVYRLMVHMPDGSAHELRRDDTPVTTHDPSDKRPFYAVDGSQIKYEPASGSEPDKLWLPDGSYYENLSNASAPVKYIDRNGNTLTYSSKQWTDTLNRPIKNPLPDNPSPTEPTSYTVKGIDDVPHTYILRWRNLSQALTPDPQNGTPQLHYSGDRTMNLPLEPQLSPSLFNSTAEEVACTATGQPFNPVVLYQIVLPNGQAYTFTYNVWGEIDKVVYPTGAYERYRYEQIEGISASIQDNDIYRRANRGVVERWVSPSGNVSDEQQHYWQYSAGDNNDTTPYTVVITAPDGSYTERLLTGPQNSDPRFGFEHVLEGKPYEEGVYSPRPAPDQPGKLLRRVLTEWTNSGPLTADSEQTATCDARATRQVEILLDTAGQALAATTTFQHDQDLNVIEVKHYGYTQVDQSTAQSGAIGSFGVGTLLRTEETTYLVNDPNLDADKRASYRKRNLTSLPSSMRVKDGAGNIVAQSRVSYDEYDEGAYPLLTYPSLPAWTDPQTNARGNPTTTGVWLNTTNTYLETHTQYDQFGNVRYAWDARGNRSEMEYASTYAYAFPTLTRSADPDGAGPLTALTTSTVYDSFTGLVTSTTDANGQQSIFTYDDVLNRLTQAVVAANDDSVKSQTTYAYDDAARIVTVTSDLTAFNDNLLKGQTLFDGLGRVTETRQYESSTAYITSRQEYDSLGRVKRASNPYRSGETVYWTVTEYDSLSRVLSVTTPDQAVMTTAYDGNTVTVTDQAGKQRRSVTDSLGRLVQVWEAPNNASYNYLTSYSYDVLGNLISVTQGVQTRSFVYDSLGRLSSASNPEVCNGAGTPIPVTYQYGPNGNLTQKTDARGITTTFSYDALNRVTLRDYSDTTPDVSYAYDTATNGQGRLSAVSSSVSVTSYTGYDALGRVTASRQTTDGQDYTFSYSYDRAGNLTSQTYPSGKVMVSEYDSAGRLSGVKRQGGSYYAGAAASDSTNRLQYSAHGAVSALRLGNQLWEHTTFNTRLQPTQIGLGTSSTDSSKLQLDYTYGTTNNNGNVLSQTITLPGLTLTQSYTYDELNRLKSAQEQGGSSWKQTYLSDRYGNRTFDTANTTYPSPLTNPSINPATNRLSEGQGYAYDLAGNLTSVPNQSYAYDAENRLRSASGGNSYSYDGNGRRVKKVDSSGTTVFVYNAVGQLIAEYTSSAVQGSGGTSYVTADTLGTPRVMTDNGGGVKARHDYLPFGEEISAGVGGRTQQQGYSQVDNVRQQFAGSERDDETGLDFMQARYYSSPMGRFTSVDPIYISKDRLVDPQAINLYAYVRNNPLSYIDPTGEYFVGTDGKRVEYKVEDGKIIFTSNNVPKDLQRMADLVSNSGSNKALSQFTGLANNETKLHFEFAKGEGNYGLHRPHDKDGNVLEWDSQNGKFKGEPAYIKDKDGNFVYQEATISIYEENIERDLSALQNDPSIKDSKMTKEDFMVATFGHEGDHNLNTKAIGIIKKRQDGGGKFDVQKKVEDPAYKVTFKVLKEIKKIRGKN